MMWFVLWCMTHYPLYGRSFDNKASEINISAATATNRRSQLLFFELRGGRKVLFFARVHFQSEIISFRHFSALRFDFHYDDDDRVKREREREEGEKRRKNNLLIIIIIILAARIAAVGFHILFLGSYSLRTRVEMEWGVLSCLNFAVKCIRRNMSFGLCLLFVSTQLHQLLIISCCVCSVCLFRCPRTLASFRFELKNWISQFKQENGQPRTHSLVPLE